MLKNFVDLSGLEYFRDSLLVDEIASGASDKLHAPSVKSVLDYINSLKVSEIIDPYGDGLATEAAVGNYVDSQLELVSGSITSIEEALEDKADKVHGVHLTDVKTGTANCQILRRPSVGDLHDDDVSEYEWASLGQILMDDPSGLGAPILNMALNSSDYVKGSIATYEGEESDIVKMMTAVKNRLSTNPT